MKKFKSVVALVLCLCMCLECAVFTMETRHAYAIESLDSKKNSIIKSAVQYIEASKNDDGSYNDGKLINDTAEACAILSRFSDADVKKTISWLKSQKITNVDTKSRSIMAYGNSQDVKKLLENQNTDGGFGLPDEYSSDILDSILVLEAVNSLENTFHSNSTWKLVQYIARQMNSDGSYSYTKSSNSNIILTSMALYTVSKYMSDNKIASGLTTDMISKSKTYLKSKFDNTFPKETIEENLYIALALMESKSLDDIEGVVDNLAKIQDQNGSFGDDVHLTSLAVWLLSKMDTDHLIQVHDMRMSNTTKAYYGVDSSIKVNYAIAYEAQIDTPYQIKCVITNGKNNIYESEPKEITLSKKSNRFDGSFDGISINENKDDGLVVTVQLLDGDNVIKEDKGSIVMENQPRAGKTSLDDFSLELSDYYAFVGDKLTVNAEYKLLYYTNVKNGVDMKVVLSKDGKILDEKNYSEDLVPEKDTVSREAISFEPDTSKEGIYTVTVSCLHEGKLVAEYSEYFYVIDNPMVVEEETNPEQTLPISSPSDASQTDVPKIEREKIPFTAKWIGPKLSDYIVYAGKERKISVSAGIIYYGDEGFKGTIKTEISKDGSEIKSVDSNVELTTDSNSYDVSDITTFVVEELGEYAVKTTLYDETGKEIISGSKSVKVIDKNRIDLIADSSVSETEERTVDISWNDISNSEDTYNYRLYRRYDGSDWEARSIWNEKDKVRVLNVYPYTPLLETWMTQTISNTENPAGMGMFIIDSVHIDTFNQNYLDYLKNENGSWKYDVLFFGSWDSNCYKDISNNAYIEVQKFVDSGRGVLFGHDTVCVDTGMTNFLKFADQLGIKAVQSGGWNAGTSVSVVNIGTLTNFPWTLRGTLQIPATHSLGQYVGGSLDATEWMSIDASRRIDNETGGHSNSYLVSNKNLALIQTGHSNGQATDDERKVLANTLFYLHQISQVTTAKDNSFYDLAAPDAPDAKFTGMDGDKLTLNISSKDNGTKYQYYIEAISSTDSETENEKSNIMSHVALSGIDGYVFVVNESAEEDQSILEFDENHEKVLNIVRPDSSDVLSTTIDIPEKAGKYYLHIYAVDKENNISVEKVFPLDDGMLTTSITTDKDEYLDDETVAVKSVTNSILYTEDGDVSISLYDSEDNFVEEVYYENGQSVSKDEPCQIDTSIVLDETYSGKYTLKIEWNNDANVLCDDMTTFSVKKADDEIIEEVVNPATPTDPDSDKPQDNPVTDPKNDTPTDDKDVIAENTEAPGGNTNPEKEVTINPEVTTELTTEVTTEATTEARTEIINDSTTETGKTNTNKNAPQTGDSMNLILLLISMFVSAGIIGSIVIIKRKKHNNK